MFSAKRKDVAEALIGFLHAIFTSFYVDVFIGQYVLVGDRDENMGSTHNNGNHIDRTISSRRSDGGAIWYLALTQLLYFFLLLKNSVIFRQHASTATFSSFPLRRLSSLPVCGTLLSFCFALMWFPLDLPFLNAATSFTLLTAAYQALFARCRKFVDALSRSSLRRPEGNIACTLFAAVGVAVACWLHGIPNNPQPMRCFTTFCAVGGAVGFFACGRQKSHSNSCFGADITEGDDGDVLQEAVWFVQQTMLRSSMKVALLLWMFQGYNGLIATSFISVFLTACHDTIPLPLRGLLLFIVFVLPQGTDTVLASFKRVVGKKRLVALLLPLLAFIGFLFILVALRDHLFILHMSPTASTLSFAVLLVMHRLMIDTLSRVQSWVLRDVVEEDTVIFCRPKPMTANVQLLLDSASQLVQCVALVLTSLHLVSVSSGKSVKPFKAAWVVGCPTLVMSVVMLLIWVRWYNLEGSHLQFVKMAMRKRADGSDPVV